MKKTFVSLLPRLQNKKASQTETSGHAVHLHYSHGASTAVPQDVVGEEVTQTLAANQRSDVLLYSVLLGAVLVMFAAVGLSFLLLPEDEQLLPAAVVKAEPFTYEPDQHKTVNQSAFSAVSLTAHSAYVYDLRYDTALFARQAEEKLPLASVIKLLTALVAYEALGAESIVTISEEDLAIEGNNGLRQGEDWESLDLIQFMLVESSNDAAHALATAAGAILRDEATTTEAVGSLQRLAFMQEMNKVLRTLAISEIDIANATGLDIDTTKSGAYGSAKDTAVLLSHLVRRYREPIENTRHS